MSRRVSLPAADDLFRPTGKGPDSGAAAGKKRGVRVVPDRPTDASEESAPKTVRKPSGRIRHDEKMTVYVTSDELLDLEDTRLMLRRHQGMAVDRGRLVREAVAMVLADYAAHGDDSALVRRLTEE